MLFQTHWEVDMGFLDKLLGRGKEGADKAGDAMKDVGAKAEDVFDDKPRMSGEGESKADEAEPAVDQARDDAPGGGGRTP